MLFGSNHPFWPAPECLAGLDQLGLDAETARLFPYENANRVIKLGL
ncbi:MAG: hypothetical protein ACRD0O_04515 [Acidimicrobiia bacterium]